MDKLPAYRHLLPLILLLLLLGACTGNKGLAPVDDRSIKTGAGKSSTAWHTVRKGETLFSIAFAHGKDYRDIAWINRIKSPYTIYPGQRISLTPVKPAKKPKASKAKQPAKTATSASKQSRTASKKSTRQSRLAWKWPVQGKLIRTYSSSAPRKKGGVARPRPFLIS